MIRLEALAVPLPAIAVSFGLRAHYEGRPLTLTGYTAPYCGPGCQSAYGSCFGTSPPATQSGSLWVVKGVGSFTTTKTFTFSGTTLPSGLLKSDYSVEDPAPAPYSHKFVPADVTVGGGYLQLKVPGGQTTSPLNSAEVTTNFGYGIKYASVRTTAILGASAGACNGKSGREPRSRLIGRY